MASLFFLHPAVTLPEHHITRTTWLLSVYTENATTVKMLLWWHFHTHTNRTPIAREGKWNLHNDEVMLAIVVHQKSMSMLCQWGKQWPKTTNVYLIASKPVEPIELLNVFNKLPYTQNWTIINETSWGLMLAQKKQRKANLTNLTDTQSQIAKVSYVYSSDTFNWQL